MNAQAIYFPHPLIQHPAAKSQTLIEVHPAGPSVSFLYPQEAPRSQATDYHIPYVFPYQTYFVLYTTYKSILP
jgi:hypothetical protein